LGQQKWTHVQLCEWVQFGLGKRTYIKAISKDGEAFCGNEVQGNFLWCDSSNFTKYSGWPKKVSHHQFFKKSH